jgi:NhaP-type Na+/H+ or K+/H+ antiporter
MRQTGIMEIWPVVSLIICMSIVLHGVTATPFTKIYGNHSPEKSEHNREKSENQRSEPPKKESLHMKNFSKKF